MAWVDRGGLVLFCVLLGQAGSTTTPSPQTCEMTETEIICENQRANIDCGVNLIHICTAVYGRTDTINCRHPSISHTSCELDVVAVLSENCDGQARCRIRASNGLAGDPCAGTYKYLNVSYTCEDVDECAIGTDDCHSNSTCTNTRDSFICTCNVGYTGNGTNCTDIDECVTGIPCGTDAVCTNNPGSFECTCNAGYTHDGLTCRPIDVDECAASTDNCHPNSTCTNTRDSFTCTCNNGYTGNGTSCTDIDECATGIPCGTNAVCTNNPGSFECTCNVGYTRDGLVCRPAGGRLGSIVPIVVVLFLVILIVGVIIAVICCRRRKLSSAKNRRESNLKASTAAVHNPSYETDNLGDQNDYTECGNPVQSPSIAIATNAGSPAESEPHEYTELPTSPPPATDGNVAIYNEVGEEDYNVLFGGKEHGDYHEYNLPDGQQETSSSSNPYQDLIKDESYQEITSEYHSKGTGNVGSKHELVNGKTVPTKHKNSRSPTTEDKHAYQDLRRDDDNYSPLNLVVRNPTSSSTQEHVPSVENSYQALQLSEAEYLELQ